MRVHLNLFAICVGPDIVVVAFAPVAIVFQHQRACRYTQRLSMHVLLVPSVRTVLYCP
jgi:hypothetical protein